MTLDELVLHNFSLYRGRQEIDLTPSVGKPIVLVGGLNGTGKTTILDAIQLALYGKFARCSNRGSNSYESFLRNCIHRGIDPSDGAAVEVQFRHTVAGSEHTYRIHRSWRSDPNGFKEQFEVLLDGRTDALLTDAWTEHVEAFLPIRIAPLFFFDGEKIEGLADFENSPELLKTAIHSVLGLDVVDRLSTDLIALERRKRVQLKTAEEQREIGQLQEELEQVDRELPDILQERAAAQNDLDLKTKRLHETQAQFEREGGASYGKRAEVEAEKQVTLRQLRASEDELRGLAEGAAPLALVPSHIRQLNVQSLREEGANQAAALNQVLRDRDAKLLAALRRTKVSGRAIEAMGALLRKDRSRRQESAFQKPYLHMDESARQLLYALRSGVLPRTRRRIQQLVADISRLSSDLITVERALSNVPTEDAVGRLLERRRQAEIRVVEAQGRVASLQAEVDRKQKQRDQLQQKIVRSIEQRVDSDFAKEDVLRTITHSQKVRDVLQKFRVETSRNHLERLESLVLDSFHQLLRKQTLVSELKIDPQEFVVELRNGGRKPLSADRLSAAERQLLAVSVLWGLARAWGRALPVVTDTPLGRLDTSHRLHLVERYFPHASHQMLLLSTDDEIDREYYEKLKPWISHSYRLDFHEETASTSVSQGYFWQ